MPHRTTSTHSIKRRNRPLTCVRAAIAALGQWLFASSDATARNHGWQVTPIQLGLGRQYRDPRFDTLTSCPDCGGRGVTASRSSCQRCSGTGRVTCGAAEHGVQAWAEGRGL
jgi:hypothetical protein